MSILPAANRLGASACSSGFRRAGKEGGVVALQTEAEGEIEFWIEPGRGDADVGRSGSQLAFSLTQIGTPGEQFSRQAGGNKPGVTRHGAGLGELRSERIRFLVAEDGQAVDSLFDGRFQRRNVSLGGRFCAAALATSIPRRKLPKTSIFQLASKPAR